MAITSNPPDVYLFDRFLQECRRYSQFPALGGSGDDTLFLVNENALGFPGSDRSAGVFFEVVSIK